MSVLCVFGIDYKSANFAVRQKMSFSVDEIPGALKRIFNAKVASELIILSTCNRVEVYCVTDDIDFVINAVCEIKNLCPRSDIRNNCYVHKDLKCVEHLFRVASGLESLILGETEIVSQIKNALNLSKQNKVLTTTLNSLFQMALSAAKEVRHITEINSSSISLGRVIKNIVCQQIPYYQDKAILFIGAGQMMQQILYYFNHLEMKNKIIANRSIENARNLSNELGGSLILLDEIHNYINDIDIIIICSYANDIILNNKLLKNVINQNKQLLVIDLSMPILTDLNLRNNANIKIFTMDEIASYVNIANEIRENAALNANEIITRKVVEFQEWSKKRDLSPLIKSLRDQAEEIRTEALILAHKQLQNGNSVEDILQELSVKLTNKLLHAPTVNLCKANLMNKDELLNLVSYLYDLEIRAD